VDPSHAQTRARSLSPGSATPTQAATQSAGTGVALPTNAEQARQLAAMFEAQMMSSLSAMNTDDSSDDSSDDGSDDGSTDSSDQNVFAGMDASPYGAMGLSPTAYADLASNPKLAPILTQMEAMSGAPAASNTTSSQSADPFALLGAGATGVAGTGAADGLGGADALGADPLTAQAQADEQAFNGSALLNAPVSVAAGHSGSVRQNAAIVAQTAERHGVSPVLAVAMMLVESGGNNRSVGDGGTSFGLFQLHEGGMLTAAGLTPQQAFDPQTNANVAIKSLAATARGMRGANPGAIAAASQRPADRVGYARKVDDAMQHALRLLGGANAPTTPSTAA
jgi:hypothetical protein